MRSKEIKRLRDLQFPTRQDMRELISLLESELESVEKERDELIRQNKGFQEQYNETGIEVNALRSACVKYVDLLSKFISPGGRKHRNLTYIEASNYLNSLYTEEES